MAADAVCMYGYDLGYDSLLVPQQGYTVGILYNDLLYLLQWPNLNVTTRAYYNGLPQQGMLLKLVIRVPMLQQHLPGMDGTNSRAYYSTMTYYDTIW